MDELIEKLKAEKASAAFSDEGGNDLPCSGNSEDAAKIWNESSHPSITPLPTDNGDEEPIIEADITRWPAIEPCGYSEKNEGISDGVRQYGREINLPTLDFPNVYTDQVRQREIPVVDDNFFNELAAGLLVDYSKKGYHKRTCDYLKHRLRPYLRSPKPVSSKVRLIDCVAAIDAVAKENWHGGINYDSFSFAKAVLDRAGVNYVD